MFEPRQLRCRLPSRLWRASAAAWLLLAMPATAAELDRAAVRDELRELKARIAELERLLDAPAPSSPTSELRSEPVVTTTIEPSTPKGADVADEPPVAAPEAAEPRIELGGAVRLNYAWQDYSERSRDRGGDFELELIRLNADGGIGPFTLSAEYRWYNDFEAVHHAWVGYAFDEQWEARLGISQVPFGLLPFASHSFWFGAGYYLGFEDDYDTGLQLIYENDPWQAHVAFFKNAEYAASSRYDRYSFDVATGGVQQNEEINQWNARLRYRWQHGADSYYSDAGISGQWGQLYNGTTGETGDQQALALHWDGHYGPWNLQLQWVSFRYDPANPVGVSDDTVQLAAFGFPFLAAADADIATANVAYTFTLDSGVLDSITCYNDYSEVRPSGAGQRESVQNVTGCLLAAGGVYTYIDWITGKNMWFINGPGIGLGADDWNSRLNINVGYYF